MASGGITVGTRGYPTAAAAVVAPERCFVWTVDGEESQTKAEN